MISLESPMHLHCTRTDCLMPEQAFWARKHNMLSGLEMPVKLQTVVSLASHYWNILTFLFLSFYNATAYFTSSYGKSAAPFLHETKTGNAGKGLIWGMLLQDCWKSCWFCRGMIEHPVTGKNGGSLFDSLTKTMLAQWTLLAVQHFQHYTEGK